VVINSRLAGKAYPSTTYRVTAQAIHSFAGATNETHPSLSGERPLAAPLFAVVPAQAIVRLALSDEELGINLDRVVMRRADHRFHAPIVPGDMLLVEGWQETVETGQSGETFTVAVRLTNQHEVVAAELRSVMFVRGSQSRDRGQAAPDGPSPPARFEFAFSSVQVVDPDQPYRFAEASGERHPAHTDPEFARKAGLPGVTLQGTCTLALASRAVVDALAGGDPGRLRRLSGSFSKPVLPGDTITTRGWILPSGAGGTMCGFETLNSRGSPVLLHGVAELDG
jgi:acyl dehydratase